MDETVESTDLALQELLASLGPEEFEPRLELQVIVDPLSIILTSDNNNRNCPPGISGGDNNNVNGTC